MKIRELQTSIADALNGVERLVQNGCTALAEDALTVQNAIGQSVSGTGRITLVSTQGRTTDLASPEVTRYHDHISVKQQQYARK